MDRKYEALDQTLTGECGKLWEWDGKATNSAESKGVMSILGRLGDLLGLDKDRAQRIADETDRHCKMKQRLTV